VDAVGRTSKTGRGFKVIKSATPTTIHQLFSHEKDIRYTIPKYQREYSWNKEQWSALFSDLMEDDALSGHFLGTIIGVDKTEAVLGNHALELVDGQQRITTISLLLLAIFSELSQRKDESFSEDQISDISNLRRMLVTAKPIGPRIQLQTQNHNFVDYLSLLQEAGTGIEASSSKYSGNRKIKKAYKFFKASILERIDGQSDPVEGLMDILNRVKKAVLVSLEVQSHADAFVLFESLNNRGLALTPIDLIKNSLLEMAERHADIGTDLAYARWSKWISNLGPEYRDQERFFRQFYNAFKGQWELGLPNIPVATRSKLITIFDQMLQGDFLEFSDRMDKATNAYRLIIGAHAETEIDENDEVIKALQDLSRVEGASSYILMLSLIVNRGQYGLKDKDIVEVCEVLVSFFVRRNLTNTPPTYALDKLFISIVENWKNDSNESPKAKVLKHLSAVSVADEVFLEKLKGPIYEENVGITRFILIALAQSGMTDEKWTDLWAQVKAGESKQRYKWTIEHIVPQGENMPKAWVEMLGGAAAAEQLLVEDVHRLGNLTITAYNANLGNLAFADKRDRTDSKASNNFIGYKNGLSLNQELSEKSSWDAHDIDRRTDELAHAALLRFPLG